MANGAETPRCMTYAIIWNSEKEGTRAGLSTKGKLEHCIRILYRTKFRYMQQSEKYDREKGQNANEKLYGKER